MSRDLKLTSKGTPSQRDSLYPPIEPYDSGFVDVEGGHSIYWETCGNPRGKPALFLHGGPGSGCSTNSRRLFDPDRYRIVLFDQRGCGRSRPHAGIAANTTAHLLSDIETLRQSFGIERWLVLGGSWGSTLALAYAQAHPERVSALILRGVFTARRSELRWLYREGASCLYPEAWARFLAPIPECERGDLIAAYYARLTARENGGDPVAEIAAARAWCAWEDGIISLQPPLQSQQADAASGQNHADDPALLARARIETHYFVNDAFLGEGQILANAHRLESIPAVIVQGRCDAITPPVTAWELHQAWKSSTLQIVPDAGHASSEPGTLRGLIAATDNFAR